MTRTCAAVLAAGEQLLLERGVHGITVEDIVRRTGIAKTTIYRHWPSKADLVMAVVARQAFEFPSPDTGDAVDDLRVCLRALSGTLSDATHRITLLGTLELASRDRSAAIAHRALLDKQGAVLGEVFRRGLASGQLPADQDGNQTLQLLVGPILLRALLFGEALDNEEIDRLIVRVLGSTATG